MNLKLWRIAFAALLTATLAGVGAVAVSASDSGRAPSVPRSCNGLAYGHMGPITGANAVLGQEQLKWSQLALENFNREKGTRFRLIEGDDQLNASQGATVAQRLASDRSVLGVVGPAGSQVVIAAGEIFARESLAMVSMSATDAALSDGKYPTFFRVNANNNSQAPVVTKLIQTTLRAKKVFIVDDQTPDKKELADRVQRALTRANVTVERETVNRESIDFSSLVSKVDRDADVVFLSWQTAASGQQFGQQMREQGKRNTLVGANGLYSPSQFTIEGAYVASFAPDIRSIETGGAKRLADTYQQRNGNFGTFGPPSYVAAQVVLDAMYQVCRKGNRPTREQVLAQVRKTNLKTSILGTPVQFAKNGNSRRAVFFLFKVEDGKYVPVKI